MVTFTCVTIAEKSALDASTYPQEFTVYAWLNDAFIQFKLHVES